MGTADLTGEKRIQESDRGCTLKSPSTMNRIELGERREAPDSRHKDYEFSQPVVLTSFFSPPSPRRKDSEND